MNYQDKLLRHYYIIAFLSVKAHDFYAISVRLQDKLGSTMGTYNLRTFQRDIKAIAAIFGLHIKYNGQSMTYELLDKPQAKEKINALSLLVAHMHSETKSSFVFYDDDEGLGAIYLSEIITCIEQDYSLMMSYQKFNSLEVEERSLIPLALKEHNKRWYVLAEDMNIEKMRVYGLDRILSIRLNPRRQRSKFNDARYIKPWQNTMGITLPAAGQKVMSVELRFEAIMGPYVISLPWHASQKTLKTNDEATDIVLTVYIDHHLINKIMACVQHVQVLAPQNLKDLVRANLEKAMSNFK